MCRYGVTRVIFQPLATLSQRVGVEVAAWYPGSAKCVGMLAISATGAMALLVLF